MITELETKLLAQIATINKNAKEFYEEDFSENIESLKYLSRVRVELEDQIRMSVINRILNK